MGIMAATPDTRGVVLPPRQRGNGGGGVTSWSIPQIPGFNRGIYKPNRTTIAQAQRFRSLMGIAIVAGRRGLPGLGDPNKPSTWGAPGPGCVPLGDGTCQTSLYGPTPCMEVRQCDTMTGALHFEYALPTGAPSNADITEVSPDSGRVIGCTTGKDLQHITTGACAPGTTQIGTQVVNPKTGVIVYNPPPPKTGGGGNTQTPTGGGGTGASGSASVSVMLQNTSRPGQPLQVGDNWLLNIVGPPNATVVNAASHNGVAIGSTNYGKTDSNGKLTLNGVMTPDTVGTWVETWTVGASSATLSFSVATAAGSGSTAGGGAGETGGGGATPTDTAGANQTAPPSTSAVAPFSVFGLSGTSLLIVAGLVLGGAFLLFGGKR
jgi:hypothetical protein